MKLDDLKHLPVIQITGNPIKVVEIAELTIGPSVERQSLVYVVGIHQNHGESVLLYSDVKKSDNKAELFRAMSLEFITKYRILEKIVE